MRVISSVNQKGGVGKTTLCASLGEALNLKGYRVLMLDLDPQGHLSQHLGVYDKSTPGMDDVIQGESSIDDVKISLKDKLDLVPSGEFLIRLEAVQMKPGRGLRLRKALKTMRKEYDYVLIDCPPSSGFLVVNAIAASNELLVPVTPDYFGLSGLSEMTRQIKRYEKVMGGFHRIWVVISRYQNRKVSREAEEKIRHYFGEQVMGQNLHERTVLAECAGNGKTVSTYAPQSKASQEVDAIADELIGG